MKCEQPQIKQTTIFGNKKMLGVPRLCKPSKWTLISAENSLWLSEPQSTQSIRHLHIPQKIALQLTLVSQFNDNRHRFEPADGSGTVPNCTTTEVGHHYSSFWKLVRSTKLVVTAVTALWLNSSHTLRHGRQLCQHSADRRAVTRFAPAGAGRPRPPYS